MDKSFIHQPKSSVKSFTLIELIVVIIIIGILAALGISQYGKMVEKGRGAEARIILGQIRTLAYQYYLENGTITGITFSDVNIGTASDQIPSACRSTHYFSYQAGINDSGSRIRMWGTRCASGGKTPQDASAYSYELVSDFATGTNTWVFSEPYI